MATGTATAPRPPALGETGGREVATTPPGATNPTQPRVAFRAVSDLEAALDAVLKASQVRAARRRVARVGARCS
jgi:hypothetical protein